MKDTDKMRFSWYQIIAVAIIAGLFTACSDSTTGSHELGTQPKAKLRYRPYPVRQIPIC